MDIFIKGETINLCIPTDKFALESLWYSWLNDPKITRFIPKRGIIPNTPKEQLKWFQENNDNRLILIITKKYDNEPIGVINLSFIDLKDKKCEIALACDNSQEKNKLLLPLWSLEAVALITQHAFKKIGIKKIYAYQHPLLKNWRQNMELLGYKVEGICEDGFIKGDEITNLVNLSCKYKDFSFLYKLRSNNLWDSQKSMISRIKKLPKESFCEKLNYFFETKRDDYYKNLYNL